MTEVSSRVGDGGFPALLVLVLEGIFNAYLLFLKQTRFSNAAGGFFDGSRD